MGKHQPVIKIQLLRTPIRVSLYLTIHKYGAKKGGSKMNGGNGRNFTPWVRDSGIGITLQYRSKIFRGCIHEFELADENGRCPVCDTDWTNV